MRARQLCGAIQLEPICYLHLAVNMHMVILDNILLNPRSAKGTS